MRNRHLRNTFSLQILTLHGLIKTLFWFKRYQSLLGTQFNLLCKIIQLSKVLGELDFTLMKVIFQGDEVAMELFEEDEKLIEINLN